MAGMLSGKVALITGGASGIGAAAAGIFLREGARVLISDIDTEAGAARANALADDGGDVDFLAVDISDEDQVRGLIDHCLDRFGALDCAFNNAGIAPEAAPLHLTSTDTWRRTIDVNLTGAFLCMKYEIDHMRTHGGGAIVNTASGAGIVATPGMSPYCATKHAILGITKTAAVENAGSGVRINAVCPGSTDTPMLQASMASSPVIKKMILSGVPMGRLGLPEEIAEAAAWLCSDRASYVSGESMMVDGAAVCR